MKGMMRFHAKQGGCAKGESIEAKNALAERFHLFTSYNTKTKKNVMDCDGPVTIRRNLQQIVTDCVESVTVTDTEIHCDEFFDHKF